MAFRIEACLRDPGVGDTVPPVDTALAERRLHATRSAWSFLRKGYWVEVFDSESDELLAGPFDPDRLLPAYVV